MTLELNSQSFDRTLTVIKFLKTMGDQLVRYDLVGSPETTVEARTVLALFPEEKEDSLLVFTYGQGDSLKQDAAKVSVLNEKITRLSNFDDKNCREQVRNDEKYKNYPIAVLLVGETGSRRNICLLTHQGLNPKELFDVFRNQCELLVMKESDPLRLPN